MKPVNRKIYVLILIFILMLPILACSGASGRQNLARHNSEPGEIVYLDHFSNSGSGWSTWRNTRSSVAYRNGHLHFTVQQANLDIISRSGEKYGDVRLEADAARAGGPEDNDFGLFCRYTDTRNFYAFLISSDGYAGIVKVVDGEYRLISGANMVYNAAIQADDPGNHIGAECIQSNLVLYVNDQKVLEAQDSTHTYGEVGLIAGAIKQPGVEIAFDNFIVIDP